MRADFPTWQEKFVGVGGIVRRGVRSLLGGLGGLGEVGKTFGAGGRAYRASVCGGWGACEGATFGDG
jgi:hypothetical protein